MSLGQIIDQKLDENQKIQTDLAKIHPRNDGRRHDWVVM